MTTKPRPILSTFLAACLVAQGVFAWVLPIHAGMGLVAASEVVEMSEQAATPKPDGPPCHSAPIQAPLDADPEAESCCGEATSACNSLCFWACAFSSGPPVGLTAAAAALPTELEILAAALWPGWVPGIPTPPPIRLTIPTA
ncbi:MAG: hypothetical protein ACXIUM_13265 [Wenzhouxiangella sp.]